ncbi:hypothetical protein BGZ99_003680 [Dissophora globulifera]|uniref:Nibrin second BRCT domain-containing protein n=1 Tax=Dissophora globulifera TaxID=979702 RepID=A0A9P6RPE9_9FUNG|nr:hypothetical protein BGZ99_003680 [Dissophora globulifera]
MGRQQARTLELEYPATVPPGKETANIQWTPNIERKTLFEHHRFISITEARYPNLNQFIECAGGEWVKEDAVAIGSQYLRECINATIQPVFLLPHGVQDVSQSYPKLNSLLKKMSYRWVNEDEIGMAIMYASTEKFCNPKYLDSLPSLEAMASLQSSLANTHSFVGSLAAHSSFAGPSTLPTTLSNVGDTIDSPQVIDDSNEAEMASFSLSQLMPLRKQDRANTGTRATIADAPSSGPATPLDTAKPAKKKAKTNRMDMFFDGLEEEDTTAQETIEPNTDTSPAHDRVASSMSVSTPILTRKNSSALCEPVLASWADEPEVVLLQEEMESGEDMAGTRDVEENARLKTRSQSKAEDEIYRNTTSQRPRRSDERIQHSLSQSSLSVEQFSQSSQSFRRSTGSKKKPSPYDTVQEDIMALKLDTRLGRQKDKMDEEERLRRLTAQRQANRAQEDGSKVMQSEYSQDLVAKKKRRKMEGEEGLEAELDVATAEEQLSGMSSPPPGAPDRSPSVLLSDEQDRKDWPERWKSLPNFKSKAGVDPILQQKWKDVPNFKAFRKSTMAGKHVDIRRATSVALDDGILEKQKNQEQTIEKIGRYVEREAREISGPAPMPRRKFTEKEMARDDLRMLLAND